MSIYLQNLKLHYQACELAVRDPQWALSIATQIPDCNLRDRTVKEIALSVAMVVNAQENSPCSGMGMLSKQVNVTTFDLLSKHIALISNQESRSKTAARFIKAIKLSFPDEAQSLKLTIATYPGKKYKSLDNARDRHTLAMLQARLKTQNYPLNLIARIRNPKIRTTAYCTVASAEKKTPTIGDGTRFEDCIRLTKIADLFTQFLKLDSLNPDQIDELCCSCKTNLILLASKHQAREALQMAQIFTAFKDKLQSPKIEKGIVAAACIVAIYNKQIALELAQLLTLPLKIAEAQECIEQIRSV